MYKIIPVNVDRRSRQDSRRRAAVRPAVDRGELRNAALQRLQAFSEVAGRLAVASHEARMNVGVAGYNLFLRSRHAEPVILSQDGDDDAGPRPLVRRPRGMPALNGTRPVPVGPSSCGGEPVPDTAPQSGLQGEEPGADWGRYMVRYMGRYMGRYCGTGLMACGAYGHGRFHAWMLGGVTRELPARAPVPLLVAH